MCGSIRIADRARFPTSINALAFNHLKFYPVHLPLEICFRNLVLGMVIPLVPFIRSSGRKDAFVKGGVVYAFVTPRFYKGAARGRPSCYRRSSIDTEVRAACPRDRNAAFLEGNNMQRCASAHTPETNLVFLIAACVRPFFAKNEHKWSPNPMCNPARSVFVMQH